MAVRHFKVPLSAGRREAGRPRPNTNMPAVVSLTQTDANTKETLQLIRSSGVCSSKQVRSLEPFFIIHFFPLLILME